MTKIFDKNHQTLVSKQHGCNNLRSVFWNFKFSHTVPICKPKTILVTPWSHRLLKSREVHWVWLSWSSPSASFTMLCCGLVAGKVLITLFVLATSGQGWHSINAVSLRFPPRGWDWTRSIHYKKSPVMAWDSTYHSVSQTKTTDILLRGRCRAV